MGYNGVQSGYAQPANGPVSLTDTFNRANGPLGANWIVGIQDAGGTSVARPTIAIAASSVDGQKCIKWSTVGAAVGTVQPCLVVPIFPIGLLNNNQYCQFRLVRHARTAGVNNLFMGLVILATVGGQNSNLNCYIWQLEAPAGNSVLIRVTNGVQAGFGPPNPTFADGDLLRISAVINAADTTIQIIKNGIVQQTVVDTNAARKTQGMPGLMATSLNEPSANYISELREFSCGIP